MKDFDCKPVNGAPGGMKPTLVEGRKSAGTILLPCRIVMSLKENRQSIRIKWTPSLLKEEVEEVNVLNEDNGNDDSPVGSDNERRSYCCQRDGEEV